MLVARGTKTLAKARLSWAIAFGRSIWCKVIQTDGLALDTRFVPAAPGPPKANRCLVLVVEGTWHAHGGASHPVPGPVAIPLTLEQLEGAHRRRSVTHRIAGEPCVVIEINLAAADALGWPSSITPIELDEATWDAARRAGHLPEQDDDDAAVQALDLVLQRLAARGIVSPDATARATAKPPAPILKIWGSIKPLVERFAVSSTVDDVASGTDLSVGQVERAFRFMVSTFALAGPGVRAVTYHVRMKAAVLFLSAEGASVADVAGLVGYGSADAMARAFRDAGLPPPSAVQKSLLENAP